MEVCSREQAWSVAALCPKAGVTIQYYLIAVYRLIAFKLNQTT